MRITKTANSKFETALLDYLEENASDMLVEKVNSGAELKDCVRYIFSEAKKQAQDGCAAITNEEVYGWAVHFYEEGLKAPKEDVRARVEHTEPVRTVKVEKKPEKKEKKEEEEEFDLLGWLGG